MTNDTYNISKSSFQSIGSALTVKHSLCRTAFICFVNIQKYNFIFALCWKYQTQFSSKVTLVKMLCWPFNDLFRFAVQFLHIDVYKKCSWGGRADMGILYTELWRIHMDFSYWYKSLQEGLAGTVKKSFRLPELLSLFKKNYKYFDLKRQLATPLFWQHLWVA